MNDVSLKHALAGTWMLQEFKRRFSDSGELIDVMGADPHGVLSISDAGYVTVVITGTQRSADDAPADLFASLMAYSGPCTVEADKFTTHVDFAWHPSWVGTDQVRFFELDGDTLRISTAEQLHPAFPGRLGRGILLWRRLALGD
jgi:hypothetical protein